MSTELFRSGRTLTAAQLNRIIPQVGGQAADTAAGTLVRRNFGRRLEEFGTVDTSGAVNMAPVINAAIAATAAAGERLLIGPGDYLCNSGIILVSNADVQMTSDTRLIRNYSAPGGFIGQASYAAAISNVRLRGGKLINPDPVSTFVQGRCVYLIWNDSIWEDMDVGRHNSAGAAIFMFGSRNRASRITHIEPTQEGGGFVIQAGSDNRVSDCYVDCDDDAYQVGTTGLETSPAFGVDVKRNQYINCTGRSRSGRLMICGAGRVGVEPLVSAANIHDNAFIGVRGHARLGITVLNSLLTGSVARTQFVGCAINVENATGTKTNAVVNLFEDASSGGLLDTTFESCNFTGNIYQQTVETAGVIKGVKFSNCYFGKPSEARETARIASGADVDFIGCKFEANATNDAVRIGNEGGNTARVRFINCDFFNLHTGYDAIQVSSSASVYVEGCYFEAAAAQSPRAISVVEGSQGVVWGAANRVGAGFAAGWILWTTGDASECSIQQRRTDFITANTTARYPQAGTTYVLEGATGRTLTLPAAAHGIEYGAVQGGTGVLTIQIAAGETARVGTLTTSAGGTIVSGSVGATLRLVGRDGDTWQATQLSGTWTVT